MALVPTQNKAKVTVSVDGIDLGSFRTSDSHESGGESLKTRPGGGEDEIVLASVKSYSDITVAKLYDANMKSRRLWLDDRVNKGRMVVSIQPLDADDNAAEPADVAIGQLIRFLVPARDSNASEEALCELQMAVEKWA